MFSSHGRSIVAAVSVIALAFFAFVHADTTAPTAAQILLQSLTPPTPFIPYNNPTAAATSPVGGPQQSATACRPVSLSLSLSLAEREPHAGKRDYTWRSIGDIHCRSHSTHRPSQAPPLLSSPLCTPKLRYSKPSSRRLRQRPSASSCGPFTLSHSLDLRFNWLRCLRAASLFAKEGYYTYPSITGYYGPATEKAVAAFQSANGISPVGSVGPLTRAKIAALSSSCASGGSQRSPHHPLLAL